MSTFVGFDMVPRLTCSKKAHQRWTCFLNEVEEKYSTDFVFLKDETKIQFVLPTTATTGVTPFLLQLPLWPEKFLRFGTLLPGHKKTGLKTKNFIIDIYKIAAKYFTKNVMLWEEAKGQLGHYSWDDVTEECLKFRSKHDVVVVTKVGDGGVFNHNQDGVMFALNSKICMQEMGVWGIEEKCSNDNGTSSSTDDPDLTSGCVTRVIRMSYIPGDVIYECKNFAKILVEGMMGQRCAHCFSGKKQLRKCPGCQVAVYCSMKCRAQDFDTAHDIECKSQYYKAPIRKLDNQGVEVDVASTSYKILRVLILLKKRPAKATELLNTSNKGNKCFNDLPAEVDFVSKFKCAVEFCEKMSRRLRQHDGDLFTMEETEPSNLIRIYGIWKINEVNFYDDAHSSIGRGLFVLPSFLEHSCRPNCVLIQIGTNAMVRCIAYVTKGEKLSLSRIPGTCLSKSERQLLLTSRYNINNCNCELCRAEEGGSLVDYKCLAGIIQYAEAIPSMRWADVFKVRGEFMRLARKVYYEYDERITTFSLFNWYMLAVSNINFPETVPIDLLLEMSRETEMRARVTLGEKNKDYIAFKHEISKVGLEVSK